MNLPSWSGWVENLIWKIWIIYKDNTQIVHEYLHNQSKNKNLLFDISLSAFYFNLAFEGHVH